MLRLKNISLTTKENLKNSSSNFFLSTHASLDLQNRIKLQLSFFFFFFLLNKLQLSFCFMLLSQFIFHISFLDQCLVHSLIFLSESNFFTLSTVLYCCRSLILFYFCFCAFTTWNALLKKLGYNRKNTSQLSTYEGQESSTKVVFFFFFLTSKIEIY